MSNTSFTPIGLDVSKRTLDVHVGTIKKQKSARLQVANTPEGCHQFLDWMSRRGVENPHVCLEATGTYHDLVAQLLFEHGIRVSVLNPRLVHAFRKSEGILHKTDALDAYLLAVFCQQKRPVSWQPTSALLLRLQELFTRCEQVQVMLQQEKQRFTENLRADEWLRMRLSLHIAQLEDELALTKAQRDSLLQDEQQQQDCQRLQSICGLGAESALFFLSEIGHWQRFSSGRELAAFWGVVSKHTSSGTSVHRKARLSKQGSPLVRKRLYLCALSARHHDPDMKAWADGLEAKGRPKAAVLGAVMRKLAHLIFGVLKSGRPYDRTKAWPTHGPLPQPAPKPPRVRKTRSQNLLDQQIVA